MSSFTRSRILALGLLVASSVPALADAPPEREIQSAIQEERDAGTRVAYYARLTIIGERDLATAQMTMELAREQRDHAIRANNANAAGYWAKRYHGALADARAARELADRSRAQRDRAREDFEASAAKVRKQRTRG